MKITRRLEVKYSYLFLLSPEQDSFAGLTLHYSPRGSYNDIVDWLPLEETLKRDNGASMPPFRLRGLGLCGSAFPESKGRKSSGATVSSRKERVLRTPLGSCPWPLQRPSAAVRGSRAHLNYRSEAGRVHRSGFFSQVPAVGGTALPPCHRAAVPGPGGPGGLLTP